MNDDAALSTAEYVRSHRLDAGMSVEELAAKVGVHPSWLATLEEGGEAEGLTYGLLLDLVRATQPPRPDWWDEGYEHDLHLGPAGRPTSHASGADDYWKRIEAIRAANRSTSAHQ